nr:hypothetical protein [uncultured Flavobacterium sp.]
MEQGQLQQILRAIANEPSMNKVAASGGSKYLGAAAFSGESFTSLYIREDSTISALSGTDGAGTTVNWLTQFGISGITLKAGDLYIVPDGCKIVSGTIATGTAIGYR